MVDHLTLAPISSYLQAAVGTDYYLGHLPGGRGYSDILTIFGVQNLEFQYFWGFSEK